MNPHRCGGMFTFAVQFLEDGSGASTPTPGDAVRKLRAVAERLPMSMVLLGWNVPRVVREACAETTVQAGATLYRWHPLLTGDGVFFPRDEWRTIGLSGRPIPGFLNRPEFTFVCPNRPGVRDAVLDHLGKSLETGVYRGVFLDRIRYPSPTGDPEETLGCFCQGCVRAAGEAGFDLLLARERIRARLRSPESFVRALFGACDEPVASLLQFRARSIARVVEEAATLAHSAGLAVGLDCLSPVLAGAVGQDLTRLNPVCDWVKIMSYGHTNAPAGVPFELANAASWLVRNGVPEERALACLGTSAGMRLPATCADLITQGLTADTLGAEVRRARTMGVSKVLAGIELVEIEGVTRLNPEQIYADVRAFRTAGADGLVLSWDLRHIPLSYLDVLGREHQEALSDDRVQ